MLEGIEQLLSRMTLEDGAAFAPPLEEDLLQLDEVIPVAPPLEGDIPVAPPLEGEAPAAPEALIPSEDPEMLALREQIAVLRTDPKALADYLSKHQKNFNAESQKERKVKQEIEQAKEEINNIREEFGKNIKELTNVKESLENDQKILTAQKLLLQQSSQDEALVGYVESIDKTLEKLPFLIKETSDKLEVLQNAMQKKIAEQEERIMALEADLVPVKKNVERLKKLRDEAVKLGKMPIVASSARQNISLESLIKKGNINPILMDNLRKFILLKDDLALSDLDLRCNFNREKIIRKYNEFVKHLAAFNDERIILAIACGYLFQKEGYCCNHMKPLERVGIDDSRRALFRIMLEKMYQNHYGAKELEALNPDFKGDMAFIEGVLHSVKPNPRMDKKDSKVDSPRLLSTPEALVMAAQSSVLHRKRNLPLFLQQFNRIQAGLDSNFQRNYFRVPSPASTTSSESSSPFPHSSRRSRYKKGSKRLAQVRQIRAILSATADQRFLLPVQSESSSEESSLSSPSRSPSPCLSEVSVEGEKGKKGYKN